jgi:hypothetical protein
MCRWRGHKWVVTDVRNRRYRLDHCKRCPGLRIYDTETGKAYAES